MFIVSEEIYSPLDKSRLSSGLVEKSLFSDGTVLPFAAGRVEVAPPVAPNTCEDCESLISVAILFFSSSSF